MSHPWEFNKRWWMWVCEFGFVCWHLSKERSSWRGGSQPWVLARPVVSVWQEGHGDCIGPVWRAPHATWPGVLSLFRLFNCEHASLLPVDASWHWGPVSSTIGLAVVVMAILVMLTLVVRLHLPLRPLADCHQQKKCLNCMFSWCLTVCDTLVGFNQCF